MPYDEDFPCVLPGDETLAEWMDRINREFPGMTNDVPF